MDMIKKQQRGEKLKVNEKDFAINDWRGGKNLNN